MDTYIHEDRDNYMQTYVYMYMSEGRQLTVLNAIDLINETLIGQLSGQRGHKVNGAIQQHQGINGGNCGLTAGLGLRPFQVMLHMLQEIGHSLQ